MSGDRRSVPGACSAPRDGSRSGGKLAEPWRGVLSACTDDRTGIDSVAKLLPFCSEAREGKSTVCRDKTDAQEYISTNERRIHRTTVVNDRPSRHVTPHANAADDWQAHVAHLGNPRPQWWRRVAQVLPRIVGRLVGHERTCRSALCLVHARVLPRAQGQGHCTQWQSSTSQEYSLACNVLLI